MGKSTISMAIFNSFLYVYRRVYALVIKRGHGKFPICGDSFSDDFPKDWTMLGRFFWFRVSFYQAKPSLFGVLLGRVKANIIFFPPWSPSFLFLPQKKRSHFVIIINNIQRIPILSDFATFPLAHENQSPKLGERNEHHQPAVMCARVNYVWSFHNCWEIRNRFIQPYSCIDDHPQLIGNLP